MPNKICCKKGVRENSPEVLDNLSPEVLENLLQKDATTGVRQNSPIAANR
jgi:hypothetical protein